MAITTLARSPGLAWSVPNILTYGRVAAVPGVAGCLFSPEIAWMRWIALGIFIAGPAGDEIVRGVTTTGLVLLWLSALLTLYTGWDYLKAGLKEIIGEPS